MSAEVIRLVRDGKTGRLRPVPEAVIEAKTAELEQLLKEWHESRKKGLTHAAT